MEMESMDPKSGAEASGQSMIQEKATEQTCKGCGVNRALIYFPRSGSNSGLKYCVFREAQFRLTCREKKKKEIYNASLGVKQRAGE